MISLEDLGFVKGIICETLVSTYTNQGYPNIAPMGVIGLDSKKIMIKIYKSSNTYKNLVSKRCAIVNLSSDPSLFYQSAMKETNSKDVISIDLFEKGDLVDAPKLKTAEATLEVTILHIKELDSERVEILFEVKAINAPSCFPKVHCRAFSAAIESIILATRIKLYLVGNHFQKKQAIRMIEKVANFKEIVNRTAPKSEYADIISDLIRRIEKWKENK